MMQETLTSSKQLTERSGVANAKGAEGQSLVVSHSAQVRPGLGPAGVTTPTTGGSVQERARTVPIATGAEPVSIWGTGQSDDNGEYTCIVYGSCYPI